MRPKPNLSGLRLHPDPAASSLTERAPMCKQCGTLVTNVAEFAPGGGGIVHRECLPAAKATYERERELLIIRRTQAVERLIKGVSIERLEQLWRMGFQLADVKLPGEK